MHVKSAVRAVPGNVCYLPWPHFVSSCDSLMLCVCSCELCEMTTTGVGSHSLVFCEWPCQYSVIRLGSHFVGSKQLPLKSCSRLWWWVLHEAHSHGALPEEPPAHQRDPERECGARRPLRGHHSQNASPETPGSVFNGSSGKEKGCGCSCSTVGLGSAPRLGSFDHLRDCSCCLSMFCVLQEIIPGISWELQNMRLHLLCCFVLEDHVKLYFVLWDVPSLSSILHFYTQPSVCSVKVWWLISTGRVLISDTWQLTLFVIILFYFSVNCPYANIFHWKLNLY